MFLKSNRILIGAAAIWLIANLLTAIWLNLDPDEAYYWMYAHQLDWGYFDHPPFIALLIKFGISIFPGTLGVRLGTALLQIGTIFLLWLLVDRPKTRSAQYAFLWIVAAIPFIHVYGFVSTPDSPLLFFTALFFWVYKRFVQTPSWTNVFLLALVMAALLYSKYHGLLVIVFTVLSNGRLWRQTRFWAAGILGTLLFLPHLYWQYAHDFPTFRYHLNGRNDAYELKYTTNFLINQLLIFSPFLFPFIVQTLCQRPKDALQRAFLFVTAGFWLFFLYSSFKGHVEPHWTAVLSIPFMVGLYYSYHSGPLQRAVWLWRMASLSTLVLILIRLFLLFPIVDLEIPFHKADWVPELMAKTADRPLVFIDSYRNPAIFSFYSGRKVFTYTDIFYRPNQFDIWEQETYLHGKDVYLTGPVDWETKDGEILILKGKRFMLTKVADYQVTNKVKMDWLQTHPDLVAGDTISTQVRIINPYAHTIHFNKKTSPIRFIAQFDEPRNHLANSALDLSPFPNQLAGTDTLVTTAKFVVPTMATDDCLISFCIVNGDLRPAYSSPKYKIRIVEK